MKLKPLASAPLIAMTVFYVVQADASGQAEASSETAPAGFTSMSLQDLLGLDVFTSASLLPTQTSKVPGTAYSFHRRDFNKHGARRLDDLLQLIPGLQLNQNRKRHNAIWARGLLGRYNDKMVLLVDGVRMQHLYYGHFSLGDNFPLERIEKVEVLLGPASSLYGANAFAGIISVTTRDFSDQPQLEITLDGGDNHRGKTTAAYSSQKFQAFGSYLHQDAPFREERKSFIGSDVLQPLDEHYQSLHIKARPLPGLTLVADYSENETPFLFIPPTQNAFIEERSLTLSASHEYGDLSRGKFESKIYYQIDKAREFEIEQVTQTLGYEEYQNASMAGVSFTGFKTLQQHTLAAGVNWQQEKAERMSTERSFHFAQGFLAPSIKGNLLSNPGVDNENYAFFIQDVWSINSTLDLTVGGRYDKFEQFGDYFNYRSALIYTPDARQTWKLLYGTAIRTPSLREYLKVLEGTSFAPPTPAAESIKSFELGYQYRWQKVNLSLNLFNNNLEDFIREVPTPDGADEYFANSPGTLQLKGIETLINYNPTDKLSLRLGAAYLESNNTELGELPYLTSWSSSFNLSYSYQPKHNLGFSLIHNNARPDTNSHVDDTAGTFVIAKLFADGEISQNLSYSMGVDNLFDRKVHDPAADFGGQYNSEKSEREVWFGLQWRPL